MNELCTASFKSSSLFVAFADDRRLASLQVDGGALQRQCFRYPRASAEEHFDECPEAEPVHIKRTRPSPKRYCWISSSVKNWTSRLGMRGRRMCRRSIVLSPTASWQKR
jgi:hypothetical protein